MLKRNRIMEESLDMPLRELLPIIQRRILERSTYCGIRTMKHPADYWVYLEIISETRPDVIIEIGTHHGGSSLALAHYCDALGRGRVIAVDLDLAGVPETVRRHPRITLIEGDAVQSAARVAELIGPDETALVIEDSAHTYDNTLAVLRAYSRFVKPGGYFIVEDGICRHGLADGPSPGPYEAAADFLAERPEFEADRDRESFLVTWNPGGYLRRRETGSGAGASSPRPSPVRRCRLSAARLAALWLPPVVVKLARAISRGPARKPAAKAGP